MLWPTKLVMFTGVVGILVHDALCQVAVSGSFGLYLIPVSASQFVLKADCR